MAEYVLDTSLAYDTWATLDEFTRGYVTAAMWTLPEDDEGNTCDHLGLHDIAAGTIAAAKDACARFQARMRIDLVKTEADDFRNGADYWLTRNRHGAGFWDRGYGAVGQRLTDAAHSDGGVDWYVGDDGNVYEV